MTACTTDVESVEARLNRAEAERLRVRLTSGDRVQVSGSPVLEIRAELRARQAEVVAHLRACADTEFTKLAGWGPTAGSRPPGVPWQPNWKRQRRLPFRKAGRGR